MAKREHPLLNGIIAAVATAAASALIPAVREWVSTAAIATWSVIRSGWALLTDSYPVPGWVILITLVLACRAAFMLYRRLGHAPEVTWENSYREDRMHSALWRWGYAAGDIVGLQPFCLQCDAELVYEEQGPDVRRRLWDDTPIATILHCETCGARSTTMQGDRRYAWASVEREIRRRIRTGAWRQQVRSTEPLGSQT
ncbi:MAG: hypothetical protein HY661_19275 [Betaproteobacteria bacterium]|nr:hypothetical protein [Betaproteobacteria bacterium]